MPVGVTPTAISLATQFGHGQWHTVRTPTDRVFVFVLFCLTDLCDEALSLVNQTIFGHNINMSLWLTDFATLFFFYRYSSVSLFSSVLCLFCLSTTMLSSKMQRSSHGSMKSSLSLRSSSKSFQAKMDKMSEHLYDIIKSGSMVKRAQNKKRFTPVNYKHRWFELTKRTFCYYDVENVEVSGGSKIFRYMPKFSPSI